MWQIRGELDMKVVLTGYQRFGDETREKIKALGYEILDHADEAVEFTDEEYGCDALVGYIPFVVCKADKFRQLKLFQAISAGYDTVPLDEFKERGIMLANARGVHSIPIAELVIMRILEIYKKSAVFYEQQRAHKWKKLFPLQEITEKKAAILGTGSIGVEIAKRLKAFNATTVGFNRSSRPAEYFDEIYKIGDFENMIEELDIIIVALPLNDGSEHIINRNTLKKMNKNSILLNIGRGQCVDTKALCDILNEGKIMGAALDVFEEEPIPEDSFLWDTKNLLISPHVSWSSTFMKRRTDELVYENLKNLIENRGIINRIV